MTEKEQEQLNELCKLCCYPCEMCGYDGECLEGDDPAACTISRDTAEAIYAAGYRKQEERREE